MIENIDLTKHIAQIANACKQSLDIDSISVAVDYSLDTVSVTLTRSWFRPQSKHDDNHPERAAQVQALHEKKEANKKKPSAKKATKKKPAEIDINGKENTQKLIESAGTYWAPTPKQELPPPISENNPSPEPSLQQPDENNDLLDEEIDWSKLESLTSAAVVISSIRRMESNSDIIINRDLLLDYKNGVLAQTPGISKKTIEVIENYLKELKLIQ